MEKAEGRFGPGVLQSQRVRERERRFARFVKESKKSTLEEKKKLESISLQFTRLVLGDSQESVICQGPGIDRRDFVEVVKDPYAPSILGSNPYRLAYDLAMIQCDWIMARLEESQIEKRKRNFSNAPTTNYVSFFSEDTGQFSPLAPAA